MIVGTAVGAAVGDTAEVMDIVGVSEREDVLLLDGDTVEGIVYDAEADCSSEGAPEGVGLRDGVTDTAAETEIDTVSAELAETGEGVSDEETPFVGVNDGGSDIDAEIDFVEENEVDTVLDCVIETDIVEVEVLVTDGI